MRNIKEKKEKAKKIIKELKQLFPKVKPFLGYSSNWELVVAVILSAQCTDKIVNKVTKRLFKKYRTLEEFANAKNHQFEKDIKATGYYRMKTKYIISTANILVDSYGSKVPNMMNKLLQLPGIGRKSANVILGEAFGIIEGIVVDTHVRRLARLFSLTQHNDPIKIESDLMRIIEKDDWFDFSKRLILYGRVYCKAKKHNHSLCPLSKIV